MAAALAVLHMAVLWRGAGQGGGCERRLHDGEHQEFPAAEEHTKYQNARASGGEQGAGREWGGGGGGMQRAGNNRRGEQRGQGAACGGDLGPWGFSQLFPWIFLAAFLHLTVPHVPEQGFEIFGEFYVFPPFFSPFFPVVICDQ